MAKLVAIGDSLTQGFQSLAISQVDLSYPAIIARCMGLDVEGFRTPDFRGAGGLPCNLEWLARRVAQRFGSHLGKFAWPAAVVDIAELVDEVEDYWERGPGSQPTTDALYHNLAVWGFEAGDAYGITAGDAYRVAATSTKDDWFMPPSEARMRTAWRVLNPALLPARSAHTQAEAAQCIKQRDGAIENLILWLGANNCLGTVVELDATKVTSGDPPGPFSGFTLWTPAAFAKEYERLVKEVDKIGAENVFVGTVPHVTIAPIAKGIMKGGGRLPIGQTYFDYYTRFFIDDDDFDPRRDPHLEKAEAERIDSYIDDYNRAIRVAASVRPSWHVVDTCAILDQLAVKRNQGRPTYQLPQELSDLDVRYVRFSPSGALKEGGLIGLDGVHPTTCGYAVLAQAFIRAMNAVRTDQDQIPEPNFAAIREHDSLVSSAPVSLHDMEATLAFLEHRFHISRWMAKGQPKGP